MSGTHLLLATPAGVLLCTAAPLPSIPQGCHGWQCLPTWHDDVCSSSSSSSSSSSHGLHLSPPSRVHLPAHAHAIHLARCPCRWAKNVMVYGDKELRKDHPVVAFLATEGRCLSLTYYKDG